MGLQFLFALFMVDNLLKGGGNLISSDLMSFVKRGDSKLFVLYCHGIDDSVYPHFSILANWVMPAIVLKILVAWRLGFSSRTVAVKWHGE